MKLGRHTIICACHPDVNTEFVATWNEDGEGHWFYLDDSELDIKFQTIDLDEQTDVKWLIYVTPEMTLGSADS